MYVGLFYEMWETTVTNSVNQISLDLITGPPKKSVHESEGKTALKNEDDLAES